MKKKLLALVSLMTMFTLTAFGAGCEALGLGGTSASSSSSSASVPDSSTPDSSSSAPDSSSSVPDSSSSEIEQTPVFSELPDTLTIMKGSYEELDATLTCDGSEFTMATITYETEGNVVSVSEDGVVTAVDYGTQDVVIKAFVGEEEVASKTISVEVIEYAMLIVDLPENTLNLKVGDEGFALSQIQVQLNGTTVESPVFTAVSADDMIATVEDNKIVAVEDGQTTVTVSYVAESGKTYETTISVVVTKESMNADVNFFVRGSNTDITSASTGTAEIVLPDTIDLTGIWQVLCGDQEVAFSRDGNKLTFTDAPAGEQTYTLVTTTKNYVIEGCIYNNTVSTKEEFLNWRDNAGNIYAYTILTADIDLEGEVLETATYNFLRSFLDGRGHTISNFTVKTSLVPNVYKTGGFRNVQFINAVQDCTGVVDAMRFGFITQMMYGTVEDVLIVGSLKGIGTEVAHWGAVCYGTNADATVKDVVVQLNSPSQKVHYIVGPNSGGGIVDNVHFVFDGPSAKVSAGANENCGLYANADALAKADFSRFSDEWTIEAGEVPYISDYKEVLKNAVITVSGESNLGYTLTFETTSFYPLTYALSEDYTGISIEGSTVTIGTDAVIDSQFSVVVTCADISGFEKTFTYTVNKPIVNTGLTLLAKGNAALTEQNANTGTAVVDLSNTEIDLSTVTGIRCNGVAMDASAYTISGNTVSFVNAPAGESVYAFVSTNVEYTMNICVYNYEISSKAEFLTWRDTNVWKYAILTADIDLENQVLAEAAAGAMRGILDGRGHKISNFTVTTGLVKTIKAEGGFKNISLVNATQDCTGIETAASKAIRYGFLTQTLSGTIENVFIQGQIINVAEGISHWGILVYNSHATAVIKNVMLDIVSNCTQSNIVINTTAYDKIDNVHLNFRCTDETYQGKVVIVGDAGAAAGVTNSATYVSDAQLAKADFSLFTGIWTVEEGKLPYMSATTSKE